MAWGEATLNLEAPHGSDERPFAEVAQALEQEGRSEELVRLLEARSREVADPKEVVGLLVRAGEVARERLRNPGRAEDLFRRAVAAGPDEVAPWRGLLGVHEQRDESWALVDVLEKLGCLETGSEAAAHFTRAAELYEAKLNRKDRAIYCHQRAVRVCPKDRAGYREIRRLFLAEGRYASALSSLDRERAALGAEGMVEEYTRFAELLLDDPSEQLLVERALHTAETIDPKNTRAREARKTIESRGRNWRDRVRQLREQSLAERDRKAAASLSLLVAKYQAWADSEAVSKIKEAMDRAFLLWPAMPAGLAFLELLAERRGDFPAAVAKIEKMAGEARERNAQVELLLRAGSLRIVRLNDPAGALKDFEKAALLDPARSEAVSLAAELLMEKGEFRPAMELLEKHLASAREPGVRLSLRLRLAELAERQQSDATDARAHLEAAYQLAPGNPEVVFSLLRLRVAAGDVGGAEPLVELAALAQRPADEKALLLESLATACEGRGNLLGAYAAAAKALTLAPQREGLLARVLSAAKGAGVEVQLPATLRKAAAVAETRQAAGLWKALAQVWSGSLGQPREAEASWEEVLRSAPNDPDAAKALAALRANREQRAPGDELKDLERALESDAGSPEEAAQVARKILAVAPAHLGALKRLGAVAAATGAWQEVALVAERLGEAAPEQEERREWRLRLAQLYAERLSRPEEAVTALLALHRDRPSDRAVVLALEKLASKGVRADEISRALEGSYLEAGDSHRLLAAYESQVALAKDPGERKGLFEKIAVVHEKKLLDSRAAFAALVRAVELDPGDGGLRKNAVRLAREVSATRELASTLVASSRALQGPHAVSLLTEAAELAEECGAFEEAREAIFRALESSPKEPALLDRAVEFALKAGQVAHAEKVLRGQLFVAEEVEKGALYLRLAQVLAVGGKPKDEAVALEEAIRRGASEAELAPRLTELYEKAGQSRELAENLTRRIRLAEAAKDVELVARLSLRRAQALEKSPEDRASAVRTYSEILAARPTDPDALAALEQRLADPDTRLEAARALVPAYEAANEHRKLAAGLEVIAESSRDTLERVLSLKKAAATHLGQLKQPELAFAALARALRLSPADPALRASARRAAQESDLFDAFVEVIGEVMEGAEGLAQIPLLRERAEVFEKNLADRAKATAELRKIVAIDPDNLEALKGLVRLFRAGEDWSALAAVLDPLARRGSAEERAEFQRERATLLEQKLSDPAGAAACWRDVLEGVASDREAASALDRLYVALDRPTDLAFALEKRIAQEGRSPQGRELLFRLGQLMQTRLGDLPGAVERFGQILSEDPTHAGARDALEAMVRAQPKASGRAMEVLDQALAKVKDASRRVSLREARLPALEGEERATVAREIRRLYEEDLGQPDLAFMAALKAFAAGIDREQVGADVERLAKITGSFGDLAELYEVAADEAGQRAQDRASLLRRAARLREKLDELDDATRLWREVVATAPEDPEALDRLAQLYEKAQNAKNLSEVYAKKAELAADPEEKFDLLVKAGEAFEMVGEDAPALEALRRALGLSKSPRCLVPLDRILGRVKRPAEQAEVLRQLAEVAPDAEARKGYLARLAQLFEREQNPDGALSCHGEILRLFPTESQAISGLERLLGIEEVRQGAARLLESAFRTLGDSRKLADVLEVRLAGAAAAERGALMNEVAALREGLGEKSLAFAARLRAFFDHPEDERSRDELERVGVNSGAIEELAAAYQDVLDRGVPPALASDLWRRLAQLFGQRLGRLESAGRAWVEVLRLNPNDLPAHQAAAEVLRKTKSHRELARILLGQAALEEKLPSKLALFREVSEIAREVLSDKVLEAQCYQAILEHEPGEPEARRALARVLAESERYDELATFLEGEARRLAKADSVSEADETWVRLGRLRLARLGDATGALELFLEVLKRSAGHPGAMAALEEMARVAGPLQGRAADALAPILEASGDFLKLVQVMEARLGAFEAPEGRAALLRRMGQLYRGPLENPEMGFVAMARALRECPDDAASLGLAVQWAQDAEAEEELGELLEEVSGAARSVPARVEVLRQLARVRSRAGDVEESLQAWQRLLEVEGGDAEALAAASRLLEEQGRGRELADVLRAQLGSAQEPRERFELTVKLASALQSAGDDPGAIEALKEAHALRQVPEVLVELDKLLARCKRFEEEAEVLSLLGGQAADPAERCAFLVRAGEILETEGLAERAVKKFAEVMEVAPKEPAAIAGLERMIGNESVRAEVVALLETAYRSLKDARKLAEVLEVKLLLSEPAAKLPLLNEIAGLREESGPKALAFAVRLRAFSVAPGDGRVREELERLAAETQAYEELASAYEDQLERGIPDEVGLALWRRLAVVYEHHLGQPDRTCAAWEEVVRRSPGDLAALDSLAAAYRKAGSMIHFARVTLRRAEIEPSAEARAQLELEVARLAEGPLQDRALAAQCYRSVLERAPDDRVAHDSLVRVLVESERFEELSALIEADAAKAEARGQQGTGLELRVRLGRIRLERLGDARGALDHYREVLARSPGHEMATAALEEMARRAGPLQGEAALALEAALEANGDFAKLAEVLEVHHQAETEPGGRAAVLRRMAEVYHAHLKNEPMAFLAATRALRETPDDPKGLELCAQLAGAAEAVEEFEELLGEVAERARDPLARVALFRELARLETASGDVEQAVASWRKVLEVQPQNAEALSRVADLFAAQGKGRELVEVLTRQLETLEDPGERETLLLKRAAAAESAGDDRLAIDSLQEAFSLRRSTAALAELDRIFGKTRRFAEQGEVLALLAASASDEGAKRDYSVRRAQLLEKEGENEQALAAYAQVLRAWPGDDSAVSGLEQLIRSESARDEAARLLEQVFRERKELPRLADVLEVRFVAASPVDRLAMLKEIAALREACGQKPQAFAARVKLVLRKPEDEQLRDELERLTAETGSFEELARVYDELLGADVSEALKRLLHQKLANLYGIRLAKPELAARSWEEILRREPGNREAVDALVRIYRKGNAHADLVRVLQTQVSLEQSEDTQVDTLFEIAQLAEETLRDRELAVRAYQAILERRPGDAGAARFLSRVLSEAERYPELALLLQKMAQAAESRGATDEAFELMVRLGKLKAARIGDARGALELYQDVLRRQPTNAPALGALEEMARSGSPLRGEAATALEPIFSAQGDHLKLVQMLESRVSTEADPAERAALLRKMGDLYLRALENPEMAFLCAARALREVPDDEAALALALSLMEVTEAHDEMQELLEEVAPKAATPRARAALFRSLARMKSKAGDAPEAIECWRRVLENSATDPEALESIGRLLSQQGKARELVDVLTRQLAQADEVGRKVSLLFQLGTLEEEALEDSLAALATFRKLLELKPDDGAALAKVDVLCEKHERWTELADALVRRIRLLGPEQAIELKFRLGVVRETKLLDKDGAQDLFTEILALQANHAGALARMEGIVQRESRNHQATDVLLRAYRMSGDAVKLGQLLETRVGLSQDSWERKGLLLELAKLRADAQNEPELAFLALLRAFREDPNDADLRQRLEEMAEAAKTYDELAAVYEEEMPRIAEAKDAADMCVKLGHLFDQRLQEPARAAEAYEKARSFDPNVTERVLAPLDRLYTQLEKWPELAQVLDSQIALQADPTVRIGLLFRLGQLAHQRLDSPDRAAAAFEKVLELDKSHLASARLLEQLYEAAANNEKLLKILKFQRDSVQGPERDRILARIAQISAEGSTDLDQSIEIYRELLQKNPRNEQAFAALDQLLERAGRAEELRALLAQRLSQTLDPRELVRLNDRLGRVVAEKLQRPEEAIPYFKGALERDARHKGALDALRQIYEGLGKKDELVLILRRLLPLQEGLEGMKRLRVRLAELLAEMGRREEALDAARRALEGEPHDPADLERVYQVFFKLKAYNDAVRTLELRADSFLKLEDRDQAIRVLFEVADLWRGVGGRPEAAGAALEKVLEVDAANRDAYEQVKELYSKLGNWRAYAQAVDRYLPNLVTDEEKIAALKELAQIQEGKLGQKGVAFLAACRAMQLNPADGDLRGEVERLAEETGSHEELAAVYEEVADELPRGPLAEKMYLVLAKIHDTKLDDPAAAEAALRKVLEFDPVNERALDALAGMFGQRGRHKEFVVALEQKLETASTIELRKKILRDIAVVFDKRIGDLNEAAGAYLRALDYEPDSETLFALVDVYRRQQAWGDVTNALLRARDIAATPEERAKIQVDIAEIYERELTNDEAAIEGYRHALEFDPTNRTAVSALERLYTKLDRSMDLVGVYERQLDLTQDYRERVTILFKSAAIWEDKFQNLTSADTCIEGILAIDPQNLQAIKTLERLRRAQGRWEELVGVIERHIHLCSSKAEQADLSVEMGDVFHQQLRQVDRAVMSYNNALRLNPKNRNAMHALGTLYERSGNWSFALEMLQREAKTAGATAEAVELFYRMGKINEDMLLDAGSAKSAFAESLKIDPGYLPSIRALRGIYENEKSWADFEKMIILEAEQTEDPEAKSKAFLDVARFFVDNKEDREGALHWYEEAVRLVPESMEAARPLADLYIGKEEWAKAEKMLDVVVMKMTEQAVTDQDEALARELCRHLYRLGYVAEKLGKREKALKSYEQAFKLDATYLPAQEGLANLYVQEKKYEDALRVYQSILIHHREELTDLEIVEIYWQLGDVHGLLKQHDRAQNHFEKALAIDPRHEASLRALIALADGAGKFDKSAEYRQSLISVLDDAPRFTVCLELAKLAKEKLSDPYMAIEAYGGALKIEPGNLEVLDQLYVLYRETKQGQKAAEVLERMIAEPALKEQPEKCKRVHFAMGEILRDELKEADRAVGAFNAALDIDYRFIEAFSAIEAILGQKKQWRVLEENYARMIQRLPKVEETHTARMTLWRALGDLYARVLKSPDGALMAYQVVAAGLPEDAGAQEAYAELAAQRPGQEEKAVEAYRRALANTTNPGRVCSALAELAARRKDYDSAYMAAQVVTALIGEAGSGEQEILAKLAPYARKKEVAQRSLTDRMWQSHLFHPKIRSPIAEIMGILYEQAGSLYAVPLGQYQLNPKKHRIDVASAQEYQIHHLRYVAKVLGMDAIELFSPFLVATRERMSKRSNDPAPDPQMGVEICHTQPVCLRVGGKFFGETGQKEVYYMLARTMALLRPELALSLRLSAERLEAVFQAAISLSKSKFRATADPKAIDAERRLLEKTLTEPARAALSRVVHEHVKTASSGAVRAYIEGAELTAVRAGLFVAGEIEPVKKMVMGETGSTFRVPARSKIRDLMVFAVSEDLQALRAAVGTQVEIAKK